MGQSRRSIYLNIPLGTERSRRIMVLERAGIEEEARGTNAKGNGEDAAIAR